MKPKNITMDLVVSFKSTVTIIESIKWLTVECKLFHLFFKKLMDSRNFLKKLMEYPSDAILGPTNFQEID